MAVADEYDKKDVSLHGLGVITAAIFLAGEMAGSGVLALPGAMIGTGKRASEDRSARTSSSLPSVRLKFALTWR